MKNLEWASILGPDLFKVGMGLFADTTVQITTAYIDMTNVNNTCPQGLTYTVKLSTRMCSCSHTGYTLTAPQSPFQHMEFPTLRSVEVLKDIYQDYATSGFYGYYNFDTKITLDCSYGSGLSVTYGTPRNHTWTFAARWSKAHRNYNTAI